MSGSTRKAVTLNFLTSSTFLYFCQNQKAINKKTGYSIQISTGRKSARLLGKNEVDPVIWTESRRS